MKQVTKKVHTGNSGSSFSFSLEPTWKSTRVHSGRKYYRNKTVWVCRDSAAHDDPGYFRRQEEAARKRAEVEERQRAEKARQDAIRNAEIARVERLKKKIEDLALDYGEQASTKARAFQQLHQSDIYNEFKLRYQEKIQKVFEIESVDADQFANGLLGAIPTKQILAGSFSVSSDINEKILGQGEQIFSERKVGYEREKIPSSC